jgi:hypothetical protein
VPTVSHYSDGRPSRSGQSRQASRKQPVFLVMEAPPLSAFSVNKHKDIAMPRAREGPQAG